MVESVGNDAGAGPRNALIGVAAGVALHVRIWDPRRANGAPTGRAFVLLHGIAATGDSWREVAERLAGEGRPVYALDFRGHGLSDRPDNGYDIPTFAADVAAVVSGLGLVGSVLVGHSLGADVILSAMAANPQIAGGVALVEGGLVDARDQFATLAECLEKVALAPVKGMPLARLQTYLRVTHADWSEARLQATISAFDIHDDETVSWRLTDSRFGELVHALWAARTASLWASFEGPLAVVAADTGDVAWTAAKRAAEAEIRAVKPGVKVEWVKADHDVHSAHPDLIARLLLEAFPR
jgi:pimeloyl-ACP methyl ester carboxylesterase